MPSADTRQSFLALATKLAFLSADAASEITQAATVQDVGTAQLSLQRGLLSAVQVDIVETLLHPTETVPGYEILNLLGQGGMGVVYRARQANLNREVALKTVLASQLSDLQAAARFEQEAVTLAKLRHPHVVAAYDFGQHQGRLYFAMELIEGEDVQQLIERRGKLDEATAWGLARQAAAGLAEAARLGVVHRDIKPANMLLVEPPLGFPLPAGLPLVKIADFGLALLTAETNLQTRLTLAGTAVGSPHYMAPEQLDGRDIDARADLYALGASVYHMLVGQPPFYGKPLAQIIGAKLGQPSPLVSQQRPDVSAASDALVAEMMAFDPAARPTDYAKLIERIDGLLGHASPLSKPLSASAGAGSKRNTRRWWLALSGMLVVFLLAGIAATWAVFLRETPLPRKPPVVATGWAESLFDGVKLRGWLPPQGGTWNVTRDEEQAPVISGANGVLRRPLVRGDLPGRPPLEWYRFTLFVNPREAGAVEIQFAIPEAAAELGDCRALRIEAGSVRIVERTTGKIRPVQKGKIEPVENSASGYHAVMLERTPGYYWVYFDDHLMGVTPVSKAPERAELRLLVEGGPAWFSDLVAEELRMGEKALP